MLKSGRYEGVIVSALFVASSVVLSNLRLTFVDADGRMAVWRINGQTDAIELGKIFAWHL